MSNEALLKKDCDLSCPYYSIYFAENPPGTIENGLKNLEKHANGFWAPETRGIVSIHN